MQFNADDQRRYEWLRARFGCAEIGQDGLYRPYLPMGALPRAKTMDESIDLAMGVVPTHEKLESEPLPVVSAEMLDTAVQQSVLGE